MKTIITYFIYFSFLIFQIYSNQILHSSLNRKSKVIDNHQIDLKCYMINNFKVYDLSQIKTNKIDITSQANSLINETIYFNFCNPFDNPCQIQNDKGLIYLVKDKKCIKLSGDKYTLNQWGFVDYNNSNSEIIYQELSILMNNGQICNNSNKYQIEYEIRKYVN